MGTSLVYRTSWTYSAAMRLLYGSRHRDRLTTVAASIPDGASVVELCCGPGLLYEHALRYRAGSYLGLDLNPVFVARVRRLGGNARAFDLDGEEPIPSAEYVVMQASLYQFLPDAASTMRRALEAAERALILCEPIRNLADAGIPVMSALARRATDAGRGATPRRFDEATLDAFVSTLPAVVVRSGLVPGGREKFYVLRPERGGPRP